MLTVLTPAEVPDFQVLYDTHVDFVWRTLRRLGVAERDLADVLQEVFVIVHRKLPEFEGRSAVTTWLYRIVLRAARDRRRLAHVRREVFDPEAIEQSSSSSFLPDASAEHNQDLALLRRALGRLPFEQREIFALFELEELTSVEISEMLEIPLGTVYSRLRLARTAFKKALHREMAQPHPFPWSLSEAP